MAAQDQALALPMASKEGQVNEENEEEEAASLSGAVEQALTISSEAAVCDEDEDEDEDEDLFKPPPPKEECPLCLIKLPTRAWEITYESCCGNTICIGCYWKHKQVQAKTNARRALKDPPELPLEDNCPFCRAPVPENNEEVIERIEARMALSDPNAFNIMAAYYGKGSNGLPRDSRKAFELYLRAVELGSALACHRVANMYDEGDGVERDISKKERYLKLAAKKGHIISRYNLGVIEAKRGNETVAARHWMVSAAAGHDDSLKGMEIAYRRKATSKEHFEEAIRAKHAAKKEMASEERDKAKAARAAGLLL